MIRVNDLFCGAGGMGLGFKQAGFRLAGAWDFDKWAVESYGNNVSPKVKQADITLMTWDEMPYADVWTFGFPCQDLSVAGKQAGMIKGQTRSGLFFEVMRLLEETEQNQPERLPKIIMAENVKGLKKYLPVLEEEYNARGYKMYYTLFNSKYWGVPQNRERYFVVGVRKDYSDKPFEFPKQVESEINLSIKDVLESDVDDKYFFNDERVEKMLSTIKTEVKKSKNGIIQINNPSFSQQRVYEPSGIAPTSSAGNSGGGKEPCKIIEVKKHKVSSAWRSREFKGQGMKDISPTLCARDYKDPKNLWDLDRYTVRKLTPREYARLQGFPESFKFVVSNTQIYKQMGNAVTVPVAKVIAERIKTYLEIL